MINSTTTKVGNLHESNYADWLVMLGMAFDQVQGPVFDTTVSPDRLWDLYINNIDPALRQYHNCNCCKNFIRRYGGLVVVSDNGTLRPALWTPHVLEQTNLMYPELNASLAALAAELRNSEVFGVFLSSEKVYGNPVTGIWRHMNVVPNTTQVYTGRLKTAFQRSAEKTEEYRTVSLALSEWRQEDLDYVVELSKSDTLYRGEKISGPIEWIANLKRSTSNTKNAKARKNLIWQAVASAPSGFCHPRSSVMATLLDDLKVMPVEQAVAAFKKKMHPLQYQRPTQPPRVGNVVSAEKMIAVLGSKDSLERRFARLDEAVTFWWPESRSVLKRQAVMAGQDLPVFGSVIPRGKEPERAKRGIRETMTWVKFQDRILADATRIRMLMPSRRDSFTALVTAQHPDAPPILQWDMENNRNPVSWYVWHGGSLPSQFGLVSGRYVDVLGISLKPCYWTLRKETMEHQGEGVIFLLEGANDQQNKGSGLFPEILKSEYRDIRATIEAYSRQQQILEVEGPKAQGLMMFKNRDRTNKIELLITRKGIETEIVIDRWD